MVQFKLKHCGILCDSIEDSIKYFTEKMNLNLLEKYDTNDAYKVAYVGKKVDFFLEIVEKPFNDIEQKFYSNKGNIGYMSFETNNINEAYEELKTKAKIAYDILETPNMYEFGILDEIGSLIKIFTYKDECKLKDIDMIEIVADEQLKFHHLSMICAGTDYKKQEKFYREVLKLKLAYIFPANPEVVGGFAFYADEFYNEEEHAITFEIVCTPDLEKCEAEGIDYSHAGSDPRETIFVEKIGYTYDHYCFCAIDSKAAHEECQKKGVIEDLDEAFKPVFEYGNYIGWIKDLSENDIEIMGEFPKEVNDAILAGEVVVIDEK